MKKLFVIVMCFLLIGCKKTENQPNSTTSIKQENRNTNSSNNEGKKTMEEVYVTIENQEFKVSLETNSTVDALLQQMPITCTMEELHGNEKFYYLNQSLPINDSEVEQIQAGDIMLYGNNCLVIFYQSFATTYRYTKIGRVENSNLLQEIIGNNEIEVYFNIK